MREKQEKSLREKSPFATIKAPQETKVLEEPVVELGEEDIEMEEPKKLPPPLPRHSVLGPEAKKDLPGFGQFTAPGLEPKAKRKSTKPVWYGMTDELRVPTSQFSGDEGPFSRKFYRKYEECPCGSGKVFEGCHGSNTDLIEGYIKKYLSKEIPGLTAKELNEKAREEAFDSDSDLRDKALTEIFMIEERKARAAAKLEAKEEEMRAEELAEIDSNWARDRRY